MLLLGGGLGGFMTLAGVWARITGHYPNLLENGFGLLRLLEVGMPGTTLTWTLICVGTFWWGAVCAFALRPAWGWMTVMVAAAFTLGFFPLGTGGAVLCMLIAVGWRFFPVFASDDR